VSQSPASNELQIATDLATPTALNAALGAATATATPVTLTWTDASVGESSFEVQRSTDGINFASVGSVARTAAQATAINAAVTFTDATAVPVAGGVTYTYQVRALKAAVVAAGAVAASPAAASQFSTVAKVTMTIAQPTKLSVAPGTATLTTQPWLLAWVDNASNESQYLIERATITGGVVDAFGPLPTVLARSATQATSMAGAVAFTDTTAMLNTAYAYRVTAQRVVAAVAATATTPAVTATTVSSATSLEALTTLGVASAAPSTLSANAANGVSIVLSWIDNSTNETGFQVFRTLTGTAFGATPLATVARSTTQITSKGTAVTYTDATAAVGTTYDYRVDAVIPAGGATLASTLPSGVVSAGLTLSVPTTVTVSQVATGLQVGWLDTSNNETGFEVVRTQIQVVPNTGIPAVDVNGAYIPVGTPLVTLVASSATQKTAVNATRTFVDTTAVAGLMYAYTVRSVSTTGTGATALTVRSADSTPVVTASRSLVAPSKPNAVVTSATSITVSWTDLSSNETGFVIERGFIAPGSATGTVPIWTTLATIARTAAQGTAVNGTVSYVDTLVAPATQGTYQYRVTAVNQTGTGGTAVTNASSTAVTGNALDFTAPAAPTNLVQQLPVAPAVATPGTVVLTWVDPATNETGFSVQYATVAFPATGVAPAGTVTKTIAGANPNPTGGATLTGLVTGTTYYVRVAATNLVGATYTAPITVVAP
jgi:titin